MKIALTGSLGNISKPLAESLILKGHSVIVISSNAERKSEIEKLGASAAIGSVQDSAFLTEIFAGVDIVYLMEPSYPSSYFDPRFDPEFDTRKTVESFKTAIEQTGIKKVVHLSSIGAHMRKDNGLLSLHYIAESILQKLSNDVSIKIMRPAGFYTNLLGNIQIINQTSKGFVGGLLALRFYGIAGLLSGKRGVIVSNYGEKDIIPWVSPLDIADVISEEMELPFVGRPIRYIVSDELTCNEVAKILGEAIGKPYLKWGVISSKQLLSSMLQMKMNETVAKGLVEMNGAQHNGDLFTDYYKHKPKFGKVKLREFAKLFASVYKNQN